MSSIARVQYKCKAYSIEHINAYKLESMSAKGSSRPVDGDGQHHETVPAHDEGITDDLSNS